MLQRAANNAYSWWWASHIRTKQSKWMEQNLQDMEEKVAAVIKLIEEDGDSFARRAEMYYKKRPELIHFVEESYRAYRALAERYDHISTELQNANNTIASVFPEQLHFAMDDDDEFGSPRFSKKSSENSKVGSPKVPKLPAKDLKSWVTPGTKKMQYKVSTKGTMAAVSKSGLTKVEGLKEIGRLQKQILALQTEKEFARSSYESGLAKYWEIDNQIKEIQEKLSGLEDEFGEGRVIEDDEARTVMETTALKSCRDTLAQLQVRQERSVMEAEVEQKRIKDAREKLDAFKNKFLLNEDDHDKPSAGIETEIAAEKPKRLEQEVGPDISQKRKEIEALREKIKQHFEVVLGESLTVTEMAEKIDELVNNVINLESAVSSQTALIQRLRAETDELQAQIQTLEDDKAMLIDGENDLRNKLREMEEKLREIQGLSQSVEDQNNNLQTYFTEAHCNLDHLSEKVHSAVPDEKLEREKSSSVAVESSNERDIKDSDNILKKVKTGKELEVADASDNSTAEVKSQKDSDKMLKKVKTGKELEVADASENSPAEIKSQKDSDKMLKKVKTGKELEVADASENSPADVNSQKDGDKMLKKVKTGKKLEVADASENSPADVDSQKYSDKMLKQVKAGKEFEVADASEKSPAEAKHQKESAEQESRNLDATDGRKNLQSSQPEMVVVSGSLQKEEDSLVKVELPKESEERGEKLDHDDGFLKGGDAKLEGREDEKEHESVTIFTNEGGVSHDTSKPTEKCEDLIAEEKADERACLQSVDVIAKVESKEQERVQEEEPDWKQLYLKGMEDREKNLLMEYDTMIRDYKDTKKKLMEVEANNQNSLFEIMLQLKELKSSNAMKDEVIRSLREKLSLLQTGLGENDNTDQYVEPRVSSEKSVVIETSTTLPAEKELTEDIEVMLINQSQTTSAIEEKFQVIIDELLEENLDFWFRFSTVFQEVKKFKARVKDLTAEVSKLEERQKQGGSSTPRYSVKSDVQPLYKHLTEVQNELTVWVEKSVLLKEELKNRFSSLCEIQEEITKALKASAEDDEFNFTSYQAAKFQGEILNMKQENTKVADELQAGIDHVTTLQLEVERAQAKLAEDWGLSGSKAHQSGQLQNSVIRSRIPLSAFIFGNKPKKQRTSLFSCVLHPALHRKNSSLRSGQSSNR